MGEFGLISVAGFASAWMLLWGAAAAIPIVLHLLNRRRQQTVSWAAMRLLLQVIEKQAKRVRIEQLILLLLRTLILLTLGLVLARPYYTPQPAGGTVGTQRPPRLWILAIDNSYSMGYREEAGTRFNSAQRRAVEIVRSSMRGDAFSVLTLSTPSEPVIFRPTFDVDSTVAAVQKVPLLDVGADLASALSQINDVITEAGRIANSPSEVHVVFLSDFGQDTWREALNSGRSQRTLKQLSATHTVEYEPFAADASHNLAIMSLSSATTRALKDQPLPIDLTVTNFGSVGLNQVPVQVQVNGQAIESPLLDLPAGASRVVHLSMQPERTGLLTVSASLPEDPLPADNQRYCVAEIRDGFRVLCVENPYSDARILKSALQPPVPGQASLQVTSTSQLELNLIELNEFDGVILNDLTSLSEAEFARLQQFVASGRSLVCLLGQNSAAATWNNLLGSTKNMLGFQLTEPSETADWRIDPLDYTSPIVAPFAAHPDAGLLTTPIFRYWKVQLSDHAADAPQVELRVEDQSPLIVLQRHGKGWTASLLSAPQTGSLVGQNEPWNAMAAWPSFVPLMQQLVQATLTDSSTNYNVTVGQPLMGSQRASGETTHIRVMRPDGTQSDLQSSEIDDSGMRFWTYPATTHHGLYQVTVEQGVPRPFAVNLVPDQSDLRTVPIQQLPQSAYRAPSQALVGSDEGHEQPSDALVSWLLGSLAAMLLTESCLAWHLGRRLG